MNLCPKCLEHGVIAPEHGPTCTHSGNHDSMWFPSWWAESDETRRTLWLEQRNSENNTTP